MERPGWGGVCSSKLSARIKCRKPTASTKRKPDFFERLRRDCELLDRGSEATMASPLYTSGLETMPRLL